MRLCDYCGAELDGASHEAVAVGHAEGHLRSCTADRWLHYCEGECIEAVQSLLENMSRWAHYREGSGLVWKLTEAPGAEATQDPAPSAPRTVEKPTASPSSPAATSDWRQRAARLAAGTDLPTDLSPRARSALFKADIVTLEEVAQHSEADIRALPGIGQGALARLIPAMDEAELRFSPDRWDPVRTGHHLRLLRQGAELSQSTMAFQLRDAGVKVKSSDVGKWECGHFLPPAAMRPLLAELLGVTVDDLLVPTESDA